MGTEIAGDEGEVERRASARDGDRMTRAHDLPDSLLQLAGHAAHTEPARLEDRSHGRELALADARPVYRDLWTAHQPAILRGEAARSVDTVTCGLMKLVMTLRTRDQADIVEAVVAFHLNAGVEASPAALQATTEAAKRTAATGSASAPPATSSESPATTGVTGVRNSIDHGSRTSPSKSWM